jgi:hypothetical protein
MALQLHDKECAFGDIGNVKSEPIQSPAEFATWKRLVNFIRHFVSYKTPQIQGDRGFCVISYTQVKFKPLTRRNTPVAVPVVSDAEFGAFWAFKVVSQAMLKTKRYKEDYPCVLDKFLKQMTTAGQAEFDIMSVSYDRDALEAKEDGTTVDTSIASPEKKIKINAIDIIEDIIESAHKIWDAKGYCKDYKLTLCDDNGRLFKEAMMDTMEHFSTHVCNLATTAGLSGTNSMQLSHFTLSIRSKQCHICAANQYFNINTLTNPFVIV